MSEPLLEADDISVRRQGKLAVVDLSLELTRGECIGIAGPNSAGKSSLLAAVSGWLAVSKGEVRLNGKRLQPGRVPVEIGLATQEPTFYPRLTARENLRLFGSLYDITGPELDNRIRDLLKVVELGDWADQPAASYSGGIARRLHLALALIHQPAVLLLDEPTVGLDPGTRHSLLRAIQNLRNAGTAVILTSQILSDLEVVSTRMLVLVDGRVAVDEKTKDLMRRLGSGLIVAELAELHEPKLDLEGVPGVLSWRVDEGLVKVRVSDPHRTIQAVMARLDRDGINVASLALEPPSLEDLLQELVPAL